MAPGSVEGRFRQCRCLLRVVTGEAQAAKDTQLTADPIYISGETTERGETCVTHLSTFPYRQAHATIFLRFRIREAVSLDKSMLLMRSFQPFGGARVCLACPDGDTVDIAGG
jgi:hypothetical protein